MDSNWFEKHDRISRLQGYFPREFRWSLDFKPKNKYLNNVYCLDTTCWYFRVEAVGDISNYYGDHPRDIIDHAIAQTIEIIQESLEDWRTNPNRWTPPEYKQKEWEELLNQITAIAQNDGQE